MKRIYSLYIEETRGRRASGPPIVPMGWGTYGGRAGRGGVWRGLFLYIFGAILSPTYIIFIFKWNLYIKFIYKIFISRIIDAL